MSETEVHAIKATVVVDTSGLNHLEKSAKQTAEKVAYSFNAMSKNASKYFDSIVRNFTTKLGGLGSQTFGDNFYKAQEIRADRLLRKHKQVNSILSGFGVRSTPLALPQFAESLRGSDINKVMSESVSSFRAPKGIMQTMRSAFTLTPDSLISMKKNVESLSNTLKTVDLGDSNLKTLANNLTTAKAQLDYFSRLDTNLQNLDKFSASVSHLSTSFHQLGLSISAVASIPMALFAKSSIMSASDFVEWQNVFQQTYKSVLPQATAAMEKFRKEFDLSAISAQRVVGDIGELAVGIGFTEQQALKLSMQLNTIAADITSFRNIEGGVQRASRALFMGAMGNSQSLKMLGVAVRQNSPEFKQMEKQIMASTGATLQQARFMAVLNEVAKQSRYSVGDYSRTWMTFANSLRRVVEYTKDLSTQFGIILIDGLKLDYVLTALGVVIKGITSVLSILPLPLKTIVGLFTIATIAIGPLVAGMGLLLWATHGAISGFFALKASMETIKISYLTSTLSVKYNSAALLINNYMLRANTILQTRVSTAIKATALWIKLKTVAVWSNIASLGFWKATLISVNVVLTKILVSLKAAVLWLMANPIVLLLAAVAGSIYFIADAISEVEQTEWYKKQTEGVNKLNEALRRTSNGFKEFKERQKEALASINKFNDSMGLNDSARKSPLGKLGVPQLQGGSSWAEIMSSMKATIGWARGGFRGDLGELTAELLAKRSGIQNPFIKPESPLFDKRATMGIPKLASAAAYGSKESIKSLGQIGIQGDDSARKTAMSTEMTAKNTAETANLLKSLINRSNSKQIASIPVMNTIIGTPATNHA